MKGAPDGVRLASAPRLGYQCGMAQALNMARGTLK